MFNKILKPDEIALISCLETYQEHVHAECNDKLQETERECSILLQNAEQDCIALKNDLIVEQKQKLEELSLALQEENYNLFAKYVNELEKNLFDLVHKILNKLHLYDIGTEQLVSIIKNELIHNIQSKDIKISVNPDNIEYISLALENYKHHITFIGHNEFDLGQCIIEDGMSVVKVDVKKCQQSVSAIVDMLRKRIVSQDKKD